MEGNSGAYHGTATVEGDHEAPRGSATVDAEVEAAEAEAEAEAGFHRLPPVVQNPRLWTSYLPSAEAVR